MKLHKTDSTKMINPHSPLQSGDPHSCLCARSCVFEQVDHKIHRDIFCKPTTLSHQMNIVLTPLNQAGSSCDMRTDLRRKHLSAYVKNIDNR